MEIDSYGGLLLLKSIKHTLKTQSKSQWMHKEVQKYVKNQKDRLYYKSKKDEVRTRQREYNEVKNESITARKREHYASNKAHSLEEWLIHVSFSKHLS